MCRLFGMSGGREPVRATFWLLEAPDSLSQQSRREPDGTGLGAFDADGHAEVFKQPIAAYEDQAFANEAREVTSRTFVAHVRYASTGAVSPENTHPFEQRGRLFAHNGVIGDPERIEPELGDAASLVKGETDSERYFALITKEIERDGDIGGAIVRATRWIAENLPVFALNIVLITPTDLWALRYPDVHELFVLERAAGRPHRLPPPRARERARVGARALGRSRLPPGGGDRQRADGRGRRLAAARVGRAAARRCRSEGDEHQRARPTARPPADARRPRRQGGGVAGAGQVAMATVTGHPSVAPPAAVEPRLPPGPPLPRILQTFGFMLGGARFLEACRRRYGNVVTFRTVFDDGFVMLFDPAEIKELFQGPHEQLRAGEANAMLGPVVGQRSVLLLDGAEHLRHRRLLLPPFHGQRMHAFAAAMRRSADLEIDAWPVGEPFALLPSMQSLTLRVIVQAVFGYEPGAEEEELRRRLRAMVAPLARPRSMALLAALPMLFGRQARMDDAFAARAPRRRRGSLPGDRAPAGPGR